MNETYRRRPDDDAPEPEAVIRGSDEAVVPNDPANRDWRAYLRWAEDGGELQPAQ